MFLPARLATDSNSAIVMQETIDVPPLDLPATTPTGLWS